MPKTQFPRLQRVVAAMTPSQRKVTALVLSTSAQPALQALAVELIHANAVEEADLAALDAELIADHQARIDRETAGIPDPPPNA